MWNDVVDLRDFYDTSLGQVARRLIRRQVRELWPDVRGLRVLGLGFATPYLRPFCEEAERVIAIMPASQGVLPWPGGGGRPGLAALADETELPLPDRSIDRLLLVHAVESTEQVRAMMREAWRVLADGGRLLVVAPNRRGLWSHVERTPFGNGRPYTPAQLSRMLRDNMFAPDRAEVALFVPPSRSRMVLKSAPVWEKVGRKAFRTFAGVVVVEATKQIYGVTPLAARLARRRVYVTMPQGLRRRASATTASAARDGTPPRR